MLSAVNIMLSIVAGIAVSTLIAAVSLVFELAHVLPGAIFGLLAGSVLTAWYLGRKW